MLPITVLNLIILVVLAILLVWIITRGGLAEPGRTIILAVLAIAFLVAILRLLGII